MRNQHMQTIVRLPAVKALTGLSRSTLYAMMAGGRFPKPMKLGERAVGWIEADIAAWLEGRKAARDAA
jgi:prophage regulatory protein